MLIAMSILKGIETFVATFSAKRLIDLKVIREQKADDSGFRRHF